MANRQVIAIDQTGGHKLAAMRLYVYPDMVTETLYLLTVGDKSTQEADIQDCKRFVKQIRADPDCGATVDDGHNDKDEADEQEDDG
jgi:hypothetical protein